jgi:phosphotransferase system enzyme I (PtsI)
VTGIADAREAIPMDAQVLIDADTGEVILNPSETTLRRYRRALDEGIEQLSLSEPVPELTVMANIDWTEGVYDAVTVQADGIGLYRTEIEVLAEGRVPSEDEQEARYTEVVQTMSGKPVYIRLYDFGSDKAAPWLGLGCEHNPALGLRGARFLLSRPELVRAQARALARASRHGPISIIYPMILDCDQFVELRTLVFEAIRGVPHGSLYHGVMFEIPSCCLQVSRLLEEADFGCIGANDLVQFLFAADRTNENVDYDGLLVNPMLWKFTKDMVTEAKKMGKTLGMCGHLAGDMRFTQRIIDAGITTVSIAPNHICAVRRAAQNPPNPNHH